MLCAFCRHAFADHNDHDECECLVCPCPSFFVSLGADPDLRAARRALALRDGDDLDHGAAPRSSD
jgi:hypothetical protein